MQQNVRVVYQVVMLSAAENALEQGLSDSRERESKREHASKEGERALKVFKGQTLLDG